MIAEQNSLFLILMAFLLSIAINASVEVFHHSVLFSPVRKLLTKLAAFFLFKYLKNRSIALYALYRIFKSHQCPFCISYQLGLIYAIPFFHGWIYFIVAIATARIANLINDHSYPYLRTPR
jgi:hypothetical protein